MQTASLELAVLLSKLAPRAAAFKVARVAILLRRAGKRAHTLAEDQCNREMTAEELERRQRSIVKSARKALDDLYMSAPLRQRTVGIELRGDPRGSCLRLFHPTLGGNTWGGASEGYGV